MSPRRAFYLGALFGSGAFAGLVSLFTDYLGKDGYAHYIQTHWVSGKITIPLAIVSLLIFVGVFIRVWTSPRQESPPLQRSLPAPQQVADMAAGEIARSGSWGWGVGGDRRKVILKFASRESKAVVQFELEPAMARQVARTINDEADLAEHQANGAKRQTSWAKLDADDFEEVKKNQTRPKAPDWPKKN